MQISASDLNASADLLEETLRSFGVEGIGQGRPAGAGGDDLRVPAGVGHQGQRHRAALRRPGPGHEGPLDPHGGAHPRQGRRRYRDPESRPRKSCP